jgi:hypothetical protein
MNKLKLVKLLFVAALLFVVYCDCDSNPNGPEPPPPPEIDIQVDTLCSYTNNGAKHYLRPMLYIFLNDAHLDNYLKNTGYYDMEAWDIFKEKTHEPNTKKGTYFAYVGLRDHEVSGTLKGNSVVINFKTISPFPYNITDLDTISSVVAIYSIPFPLDEEKSFSFSGITQFSCGEEWPWGNHPY